MLKAAIIYIPGCGGSFLRRALSLSDVSVFVDAVETSSCQQKFLAFNNWNQHSWKPAESQYRPGYREGQQNFVDFEISELFVIDAWHPVEFFEHDQQESCWQKGAWPNLITINVDESYRNFIESNQHRKKYSVDWDKETQTMQVIRDCYKDKIIDFDFESMFDQQEFLQQVKTIDHRLNLCLEMELVAQLWQSWFDTSNKVWQK